MIRFPDGDTTISGRYIASPQEYIPFYKDVIYTFNTQTPIAINALILDMVNFYTQQIKTTPPLNCFAYIATNYTANSIIDFQELPYSHTLHIDRCSTIKPSNPYILFNTKLKIVLYKRSKLHSYPYIELYHNGYIMVGDRTSILNYILAMEADYDHKSNRLRI